jgi:hypothetical protein
MPRNYQLGGLPFSSQIDDDVLSFCRIALDFEPRKDDVAR